VQTATVRRGEIDETLPVTGTLAVLRNQQATVTPTVSGVLDQLPVRFGQTVHKGQIVAHLSTRPLLGQMQQAQATIAQNQVQVQQAQANAIQQQAQTRTSIAQAQSALSGARATLAGAEATLAGNEAALHNAQQSLNRLQSLFADGLVALKDVEAAQLAARTADAQVAAQRQAVEAQRQTVNSQRQALAAARAASLQDVVKRNDVQVARQQVQNARGALTTAQGQFALYTLRAPLSGLVTSIGASLGETVDTTTKLISVADLATLQLQIAVPADKARMVRPGQSAAFRVESLPGKVFQTTIRAVGTQVDATSNTVPALAVVANPRRELTNGAFAKVQITFQRHLGTLLVPKSAVLRDAEGQATVVTLGADRVAHVKEVKTGLTQGDAVEILSGVSAGDQIVTVGGYGLPDGAKVTIGKAAP
jgi:RND family efflux transporter MFP subunit